MSVKDFVSQFPAHADLSQYIIEISGDYDGEGYGSVMLRVMPTEIQSQALKNLHEQKCMKEYESDLKEYKAWIRRSNKARKEYQKRNQKTS